MIDRTTKRMVGERFRRNLHHLRTERGLSQTELAYRTGLHHTRISALERVPRAPQLPTVIALAGALEVPIGTLCEGITFLPNGKAAGGFAVESEESQLGVQE